MSDRETDTRKSTRNYGVFIPSHENFSVLFSARFSIVSLADYTQKVPFFELENSTRYSADFFCVIQKIFVVAIHKYVH